jgi:Protein of unknown function (DUF3037)
MLVCGKEAPVPEAEAFQYALLRAVPSLPRGEALNVGVVVYSPRHRFLRARTTLDAERLRLLDPDLDLDAVRAHLTLIEQVAAGEPSAGPIAGLDRSERFGWITSPSSTTIQPSPVHTGLCEDPAATLEHLFASLVAAPGTG